MPFYRRTGKIWEKEEDKTLCDEIKDGTCLTDICRKHQRSKGSIETRCRILKLRQGEESEQDEEWSPVVNAPDYIVVIDIETTSLGPDDMSQPTNTVAWRNFHVTQFAWKKYTRDGTLVEKGSFYIKPIWDYPMPKEAFDVTHISKELLEKEGIPHSEFVRRVCDLCENTSTLVAHNINFDAQGILVEMYRDPYGRAFYSTFRTLYRDCTCEMARTLLPFDTRWEKPNQLDTVVKRLGLSTVLDSSKLHSADYDVDLCALIYFRLKNDIGQRIYLSVNHMTTKDYKSHNMKNTIKRLGGAYDRVVNKWYVYEGNPYKESVLKLFA
jgi:DNA polymerase III alpha subunit (gram-positive type)